MKEIKFKPQLTPKEMLELGVYLEAIILREITMNIQKNGLKMPNLVIMVMILNLTILKLIPDCLEKNG